MTNEQIAEIAEGLTKAQRRAIVDARDMMSNHGGYPFFTVEFQPQQAWPQGIAQFLTLASDRLTPTGLAVRDYLERNGKP